MEGTVHSDAGAAIRDGIKSVSAQGVCTETDWPYDISQFAVRPPQKPYDDALLTKAIAYQRIINTSIAQIKGCLASGYPIVAGFTVYQSFESQEVAQTGIVPMPGWFERSVGGHAICIVGYNDEAQRLLCKNSWGISWGQQGFFTIPYAYLTNPWL